MHRDQLIPDGNVFSCRLNCL